jgi:hypothetical protein
MWDACERRKPGTLEVAKWMKVDTIDPSKKPSNGKLR